MTKTKTRNSSIELLRILAALFVIMLHYSDGRAFTYVSEGSAHQYVLFAIESIGICAVDLFVLISGYFLSGTQKRSVLKGLELLVQVVVFGEAKYIISSLISHTALSLSTMIKLLIPNNYYVILYLAVYFVSPYINLVLKNLTKKQWNQFVVILLLLFSAWPTLVDFLEELRGSDWFGLSTVAAWGAQQGFNVVNFTLLYILGGYLRYHGLPEKCNRIRILLPAWLVTVGLIFVWALISQRMTRTEMHSAWVYHNPLVILSAVLLFCIFARMEMRSKVINALAAASFTSFIFHNKIMELYKIREAVESNIAVMLGHILFVAVSAYLMAWVAHVLYHWATDWVYKKLGKFSLLETKEVV